MATQAGMVDQAIFAHLQDKIDEESAFRDKIRDIVQDLEKHTRDAQAKLSRIHSVPAAQRQHAISAVDTSLVVQKTTIQKLSTVASTQPYYKHNFLWTRAVQDATFTMILYQWAGDNARLLSIEEVGTKFGVDVNLKDEDKFHLTIEEYLLALVSLIDELARLARNSVTMGDYHVPLLISEFIKDVHAGFQILNLKNDILRKRSDAIKYKVKEVEDVVYDLSLRNLLPKDHS